jgi:hypothetical protein
VDGSLIKIELKIRGKNVYWKEKNRIQQEQEIRARGDNEEHRGVLCVSVKLWGGRRGVILGFSLCWEAMQPGAENLVSRVTRPGSSPSPAAYAKGSLLCCSF